MVKADARTGKLVRRVVAPKMAAKISALPGISRMVEEAAQAHKVDPLLVHSMIKVESGYNPYAISPKGATGLMQLMPPTARELGVKNSFDPRQNIEAGVRYLRQLQDLYKDDRLALAAYNAGPGAVKKWGNVPPYPETLTYVDKVGKRYVDAQRSAAKTTSAAKQAIAPPSGPNIDQPEELRKVEHYFDQNGRLHLRTR